MVRMLSAVTALAAAVGDSFVMPVGVEVLVVAAAVAAAAACSAS